MPKQPINTLKCLEEMFANGHADETSGNVEAPTGHFYRIGAFVVFTDSQGFHSLEVYGSEDLAKQAFEHCDREYAKWEVT